MNQPTPKVVRDDVERIVRRDFSAEQFANAMSILDEYEGDNDGGRARIQLAVLKLSGGNMDSLRENIKVAKIDYRDVVSSAEYPEYCRNLDTYKLPVEERKQIYDQDWKQYETWLNAK